MAKKKSHVKPTKEELEQTQKEALEAEEKPEEASEEDEVTELTEDTKEEETPEETEKEPEEKERPEKLKEKLSASARENQKIYAKNRVITKALADAEDVPEPTAEELQAEFTDWDVMSDTEKTFAKETVVSRRWRETIAKAKEQASKIEKWNETVDEFVDNPASLVDNPELEGKTDEFKEFATQEANNSVPMKILVSAFLHENSSGRTPNKGRMFEKGSGGPNDKPQPKSDKLTLEESRKLRDTDYNKWKEYLKAGKIEQNF